MVCIYTSNPFYITLRFFQVKQEKRQLKRETFYPIGTWLTWRSGWMLFFSYLNLIYNFIFNILPLMAYVSYHNFSLSIYLFLNWTLRKQMNCVQYNWKLTEIWLKVERLKVFSSAECKRRYLKNVGNQTAAIEFHCMPPHTMVVNRIHQLFGFLKNIIFYAQQRRETHTGTNLGHINDDRIAIWGWIIPFRLQTRFHFEVMLSWKVLVVRKIRVQDLCLPIYNLNKFRRKITVSFPCDLALLQTYFWWQTAQLLRSACENSSLLK